MIYTGGLVIIYKYDIYRRTSNHQQIIMIHTEGLVITYEYDIIQKD